MKSLTKKQLQEKVEQLNKEIEEEKNSYKYLQAEFDNFRKYIEKEKASTILLANGCLIKELLEILDTLDEAIKSDEGLKLIQRRFIQILEKNGLSKIKTDKFDPHFHEVLQKVPSDKEEDTILEEIQKGYTLHSKVIRPSKIKISGGK